MFVGGLARATRRGSQFFAAKKKPTVAHLPRSTRTAHGKRLRRCATRNVRDKAAKGTANRGRELAPA